MEIIIIEAGLTKLKVKARHKSTLEPVRITEHNPTKGVTLRVQVD